MNEFSAQTGGRYVYVDDVLNLQDLALAFGHIFDECDNFIISGCEVSGSTISSGYVYLNGKVRYFSGANGITAWPQYLHESNSTESVNYVSGGAKVGRNIYSVFISSSIVTTADPLTKKAPVVMTIAKTGGTRMKDAFFGKYALALNPTNLSQVLNSSLKIDGGLEVTGMITSTQNRYRITDTQATFDAFFNNGVLNLKTQYDSGGNNYTLSMENNTGLCAYVNNTSIFKAGSDGIYTSGYAQASLGILGGTGVSSDGIYNRTTATNTGTLNINMVGYNGGTTYYRNTTIGDGKGTAIVSVNGQNQTVGINGTTTIVPTTDSCESLVISSKETKDALYLQNYITWKDVNKTSMAIMGFTEVTDQTFRIINNIAGVYVYGATNTFVDLGPAIKENGQLLTDKYLQITDFNNTAAKIDNVYSKTQSDALYSKVADGLDGYISAGYTQEKLRNQIGAISSSALDDYAKKSAYLSDIATTDELKKKIRNNIGAAGTDEFQAKLKDSGWIQILDAGLFIRQIGNIVSIQGKLVIIGTGTIFRIPNGIDPPTYDVGQSIVFSYHNGWSVVINAGSRDCKVVFCRDVDGKTTEFSLTYMV
jgi:hypothetical protein